MSDRQTHTTIVKNAAYSVGFTNVRIARAELLDEESQRLRAWLEKGFHGEMRYMENHFEKRTDPRKLVPGAKSVVCLAYNYYHPGKQYDPQAPKISKYAMGRDYHKTVKKKLKELYRKIQGEIENVEGRYFVDSAPVMERDLARRSGLGWIGKNTLLINPSMGSYFFLAELILNLELDFDTPIKDYCGTCTKCIDACPTDAILPEGYEMDGSRCISYLTIELKGEIPEEFSGQMENWAFGCDICQDVCPWNRFAKEHNESEFLPKSGLLEMTSRGWDDLTEKKFKELFEGSAVKRTGFEGLKRNIRFLKPDYKE